MNHTEFFAQVKAGQLRGAYLFEGTEEYIKSSALAAAEKALLPEGMEQLNETVLENPPTDALVAAAETLPFLAEKRLVVVRELAALTGRSESDERLLDYIGKIPDTCVVIFYVQGKVDARKKLAAALKKQGTVVSFAPLEDAALNAWIVRTAKNLGKEIAMGDAGGGAADDHAGGHTGGLHAVDGVHGFRDGGRGRGWAGGQGLWASARHAGDGQRPLRHSGDAAAAVSDDLLCESDAV